MHRRSLRYAGLTIEYDERVLEPRPWTELQARWAAELAEETGPGPLLELCSGAGHIGLAAAALSGRDLVCVDVSPDACHFTRLNAVGAGLDGRVEVRQAPLAEALRPGELFAVVVADPPWVPDDAVASFPDDPLLAIAGGADGLDLARDIVDVSGAHLAPGGALLVQLGDDAQADALTAYAAASGWVERGRRHGPTGRGLVLHLGTPTSTNT